ncbi:MAG: HPr family phosphocarrier protein [Lachnospiraceae bacterium]|jgi:phosphotransferase system HPr (HPr) family protein|uniref:HPr family phosphocarrier protein n=1 Tax=Candidatus Merdisoma sp. JLR.KK006 TaxID=3112626 RepID=UPI002FF19524|nr:HPr family phosphocarrier protein [Lachnospiraceae bacterium]
MVVYKVEIRNHIGLHAHPSYLLAEEAEKFKSDIQIRYGEKLADAKKSICILALGVNSGESIEVLVSGEDEEEAAEGMLEVFRHMGNA